MAISNRKICVESDACARELSVRWEIKYIFINYIVSNIPLWITRKCVYRALGMKIGKGSRILMKTKIINPERIEIGDHSYINEGCFLDGRGGITIGNNVTVAIFSKIITAGHLIDDEEFAYYEDSVYIGSHVAIFRNTEKHMKNYTMLQ